MNKLLISLLVTFGISGVAQAEGDAAAGKANTAVCAACHSADGNSAVPNFPKLAGQNEAYLLKQLADYARPQDDKAARINGVMAGMVASMSAADRLHVAAHYAAQPHKPGEARNRATLELGQRIFRAGIPSRGVPACGGCHGPGGAGIPGQALNTTEPPPGTYNTWSRST